MVGRKKCLRRAVKYSEDFALSPAVSERASDEESLAVATMASDKCGWTQPPASAFQSEPVNINIGHSSDRQTVPLPKKLLGHFSAYFDKIFAEGSRWSEALSNTCTLDEDDDDYYVYNLVFRWMLTGKLGRVERAGIERGEAPRRPGGNYEGEEAEKERLEALSHTELCLVWAAAQKRSIPKLQNDVIDELHASILVEQHVNLREPEGSNTLHFIYEHSFERAKLRRLVVEAYVRVPGPLSPLTQATEGHWPKALLVGIVKKFDELAGVGLPSRRQGHPGWEDEWKGLKMCEFHEHAKTKEELAELKECLEPPDDDSKDGRKKKMSKKGKELLYDDLFEERMEEPVERPVDEDGMDY
ncbi:MAG: hypothetical protein M1831_000765 [Alyxoria varia]|nr:MAG: hypothetical protein M1831_000765 [Alyxoria varia]